MREYDGKNPGGRPSFYVNVPRDIAAFMRLQRDELPEVTIRRMPRLLRSVEDLRTKT